MDTKCQGNDPQILPLTNYKQCYLPLHHHWAFQALFFLHRKVKFIFEMEFCIASFIPGVSHSLGCSNDMTLKVGLPSIQVFIMNSSFLSIHLALLVPSNTLIFYEIAIQRFGYVVQAFAQHNVLHYFCPQPFLLDNLFPGQRYDILFHILQSLCKTWKIWLLTQYNGPIEIFSPTGLIATLSFFAILGKVVFA